MMLLLIASAPAWAGKIEHHTWQGTTTCTEVPGEEDAIGDCSAVATVTMTIKGRRDALGKLTFRGKYRCTGTCIRPVAKVAGTSTETLIPVEQDDGSTKNELVATLEATVTFKGGKACLFAADNYDTEDVDGDIPPGSIFGGYSCFAGSPFSYEDGDLVLVRVK
jgi:hypothetical protein